MKTLSLRQFLGLSLALLSFESLNAQVIYQPTGVIFDTGTVNLPISQIIDQSGLSQTYTSGITIASTYLAAATHNSGGGDNVWASQNGVTSGNIIFDLGQVRSITEFYIWGKDGTTFSPNSVELFTASSMSDFAGGSSISAYNVATSPDGNLNAGASVGQTFTFAETSSQYVRLQIINNYGGSLIQIGEVAFGGTAAVPEPSTYAAIFGAIALLGTIAVRRRLKQA